MSQPPTTTRTGPLDLHRPGGDGPPLPDILYLSRADLQGLDLSFEDVVQAVESVFREKGLGRLETPPKRGVLPQKGCSIRGMMASVPSLEAAGVKWISAFPANAERGWPTIAGLTVLNDVATGFPKAVMDCGWITAVRTAASTVVAARAMARPESARIGLVACGLQGRVNLQGLCRSFPLTEAKVYDRHPEVARAFADALGPELGLTITPVESAEEAARDVDILVTSLPIERRPKPPIGAGVLAPGSFACLLDYHAAITLEAFAECDKLVVDDQPQLRFFRSVGYFRRVPEPDGDLGKIAAGRQVGREFPEQRIVSINQGIGMLDIATAELLYRRARERGVGVVLPA